MEFKERMKLLREEKGATYTEIGMFFGKTESATRAWELGRSKPDADTLIEIAKYFNVTSDFLLGLSDTRNAEEAEGKRNVMEFLGKAIAPFGEGGTMLLAALSIGLSNLSHIGSSEFASNFRSVIELYVTMIATASRFIQANPTVEANDLNTVINEITNDERKLRNEMDKARGIAYNIVIKHAKDNPRENEVESIQRVVDGVTHDDNSGSVRIKEMLEQMEIISENAYKEIAENAPAIAQQMFGVTSDKKRED